MVPIESPSEILLADTKHWLALRIEAGITTELSKMFQHWLEQASDTASFQEMLATAAQRIGAQQDYQTVAVLGYSLEVDLPSSAQIKVFSEGLSRLTGRQAFVDGVPMAFCSDAVAILGLSIGARRLGDEQAVNHLVLWLQTFLNKIWMLEGTEDWQRAMFAAADQVLDKKIGLPEISPDQSPDLSGALAEKGLVSLSVTETDEFRLSVIREAIHSSGQDIPAERALLRLTALNHVTESAPVVIPGRVTPAALVALLERFHAALRNWTWETKARTSTSQARQWSVDHEYHVQNMLWFLLSPIFPDLDDEFYLEKIGQKSPRADLYIPSMKIIVEAKFMRRTKTFQSVIDEISSDASLYSAMGNDFQGLIAFIWDDSGRVQEHDYLKRGLSKLTGVISTVVVTRPSDWTIPPTIPPTEPSGEEQAGG
jgi:REase_DpnII-MboI